MGTHTCSSPGQSCPSPSCPPDAQAWPPADGSLSLVHESADQCQRLHTPHRAVHESDKQTKGAGEETPQGLNAFRLTNRMRSCFGEVVCYLPGLIVDLESQLPCWGQNQRNGILLTAAIFPIFLRTKIAQS